MKDDLKKYISQNRDQFEKEEDLDGLWLNISAGIEKEKSKSNFWSGNFMKIAAVLLVALGFAWLMLVRPAAENNQSSMDLTKYSLELAEAQGYYSSVIDVKMRQIKDYEGQIDPQIFEDLEALDIALKELQDDLKDNIDNDEVIDAMIQNYRIKLEILERIQSELDKENNENIES